MLTGKRKIDHVLKQVERVFMDDLIAEVCHVYTHRFIDQELNEESLNNLLVDYEDLFEDHAYDGQYTWIALAYTQFELGLLTDLVKANALEVIRGEIDKINRSQETKFTLDQLLEFQQILNSEMPQKAVVRKPKYYKCPWNVGDVFAFKLDNPDYIEPGLQGKYVLIVKAGEHICHPRHVCPLILYYNWIGDEPIYDLKKINTMDYLPTFFFDNYVNYKVFLIIEKERELMDTKLIYIGNIESMNLPPYVEFDLRDENKKSFSSVNTLKNSGIPLLLYQKLNYKIKPDDHTIVAFKQKH